MMRIKIQQQLKYLYSIEGIYQHIPKFLIK